jgi:hypothetical protein
MTTGVEKDPTTGAEEDVYGDTRLFGNVARAAAQRTPGLVTGAVENSLAGVMELAAVHNPNLAIALRGILGAVVEYAQASEPMVEPAQPKSVDVQPPQLINPETRIGGM